MSRFISLSLLLYLAVGVPLLTSCGHSLNGTDATAPVRTTPASGSTVQTSVIALENQKSGTRDWEISNAARDFEIQGYASATSVNRGGEIRLFISSTDPSYAIDIFRMGWYGGAGGRRMLPSIHRTSTTQPRPYRDPVTHYVECDWGDPFILTIPSSNDSSDWPSGIYLAKLTAIPSGNEAYIIFVVRDDARSSDLLFQSSVTTYQAYNQWGGYSLYSSPRAVKVSFNRPYDEGNGAGEFLRWEYNWVRYLEREGYDVTYSTNIDTHASPDSLLSHKAFLSVGHDEYWSWEMRDAVEAARDRGVNLGFFGANAGYWQVRFESSVVAGEANRTLVCYKRKDDPITADPSKRHLRTYLFRSREVNRPEELLIGQMYEGSQVSGDVVIDNASHWMLEGTGLRKGDRLPGLLGYEVDRMFGRNFPHRNRVASSPYVDKGTGKTRYAHMTEYTAASGAEVVSLGTMQWAWGVDDYRHPGLANVAAQRITQNVLKGFGAVP